MSVDEDAMFWHNQFDKLETDHAQLVALVQELRGMLSKAAYELNAIRVRDGAPQVIHWDRGRPFQTDACDSAYFDSLVDRCFATIQKANDALEARRGME